MNESTLRPHDFPKDKYKAPIVTRRGFLSLLTGAALAGSACSADSGMGHNENRITISDSSAGNPNLVTIGDSSAGNPNLVTIGDSSAGNPNRITISSSSVGDSDPIAVSDPSSQDPVDEKVATHQGGASANTAEVAEPRIDSVDMPSWGDLTSVQKQQFGNKKEYAAVVEQLQGMSVSVEGYNAFVDNIEDISDTIKAIPGAMDLYPGSKVKLVKNPRIVLHLTAWKNKSAWGYDGVKFHRSLVNTRKAGGGKVSVQYYIDREGKLSILNSPDEAAYHAGKRVDGYPFYNGETTGVEMPAYKQSDITTKMYEASAYLVAWQYLRNNGDKVPTLDEMRRYVIGHGEIAEYTAGKVSNHNDYPKPVADHVAFYAWQCITNILNNK